MATIKLSDFGLVQRDLNDLSDVNIVSSLAGEFLKWDGTNWINDRIEISDVNNLNETINAIELGDLANVTLTNLQDGNVISYNAASGRWEATTNTVDNLAPVAYSGDMNDLSNKRIGTLSDVSISSPASQEVLTFDGTTWKNQSLPFIPTAINDLSNVSATSPNNGDVLIYDSNTLNWVSTAANTGVDSRIIYVSGSEGNDASGNGSTFKPFKSISRALDEIGDGTSDVDLIDNWAIIVEQGQYLESLNLPLYRSVNFYAVGVVILGDGGLDPATRGDVYIPHSDLAGPTSVQNTSFSQQYIAITEKYRSDFNAGWTIKGDVTYDVGDAPITNLGFSVLGLIGVSIEGNLLKQGSTVFNNQDVYVWSTVLNNVDLPDTVFRTINASRIAGSFTVGRLGQVLSCDFRSGITITTGLDEASGVKPLGLYFTNVEGGNISVPADITLSVDGTTWNSITTNNVSIVGGGTVAINDTGSLLSKLLDVDASDATIGQILKWNGNLWIAADETGGTDNNVDGVFWDTPPTQNKTLSNNGKTVEAATDEWSTVIRLPVAEENLEKIYAEYVVSGQAGDEAEIGIANKNTSILVGVQPSVSDNYVSVRYSDSKIFIDGVEVATLSTTLLDITADQTIQFAFDGATGNVWIGVNGVWDNGGDPETGTNPTFALVGDYAGYAYFANPFSAGSSITSPATFVYEPPVGYTKLTSFALVRGRLGDLDDVTVVSASEPDFLGWDNNAQAWVNREVTYANLATKPALTDLTNVTTTSSVTGDILRYNGTTWVNQPFPTITSTLADLTDTTISSPQDQQVIRFDGVSGTWKNVALSSASSVSDLTDTTIGVRNSGDLLKWNGSTWINQPADWSEITSRPSFASVATSGSYNDLVDQPTIPVNSDFTLAGLGDTPGTAVANAILRWNPLGTGLTYASQLTVSDIAGLSTVASTGSYTDLSNRPNLADVATSGSYTDLVDKPVIPTNLGDLNNVSSTPPTANQVLRWTGTTWSPSTETDTSTLADLTDTAITSPQSAQVLRHDGTNWKNTVLAYNDLSGKPDLSVYTVDSSLNPVAKSGNYNDLSNKPAIPSNSSFTVKGLSDTFSLSLPNGYLRWNSDGTQVIYEDTIPSSVVTGLAAVATSGSYADLVSKPSIPTTISSLSDTNILSPVLGHVLRWSGTTWANTNVRYSEILNTPNLSVFAQKTELGTTAFSNLYNDLDGRPTIPTNSSFTIKGLSDTTNASVANGYLRWNAGGTVVEYVTSIPASSVSGLHPVATTGNYNSLSNKPAIPTDDTIKASAGELVGVGSTQNGIVVTYNSTSKRYDFNVNDPVITLAGAVAGSATMNNLNNVTINVSQQADSVILGTHTLGDYVEFINAGDGLTSDQALAAEGLSPTLSVDSSVIRNLGNQSITGDIQIDGNLTVTGELISTIQSEVADPFILLNADSPDVPVNNAGFKILRGLQPEVTVQWNEGNDTWELSLVDGSFHKIWHAGNDGSGSTLDADLLDGQHGSYYLNYNNLLNRPAIPVNSDFDLLTLNDTSPSPVANGYLRWNSNNTQVVYEATIPAGVVSGLSPVAVSGDYNDLINTPVLTTSLSELTDTTITTPADSEYLRYDGFTWKNATIDYSELANLPVLFSGDYNDLINTPDNASWDLNQLGDVDVTGLLTGDLLSWNGTSWVPTPSVEGTQPSQSVYVSTNGDDANTGSFFSPVASVRQAANIAESLIAGGTDGVTIVIGPGHYDEQNPITVDSENIIINGSGSESTSVSPIDISQPLFVMSSADPLSGPAIRNILLKGGPDNVNQPNSVGIAIEGDGVFFTTRLSFQQFNKAVNLGNGQAIPSSQRFVMDNSTVVGCFTGIYSGQANAVALAGTILFSNNIDSAFHAENGGSIIGTVFEIRHPGTKELGSKGIRTGNSSVASYKQGIVDGCDVGALIEGTSSYTILDGLQFSNNNTDGQQTEPTAMINSFWCLFDPNKISFLNADSIKSANIDLTTGNFRIGKGFGLAVITNDGEAIVTKGSASLPSLRFLGDTNTGIYSPADDNISLVTNGLPRLSIDANGNLNLTGSVFINSNSLKDVATSADYNDLINTPTNSSYSLAGLIDTANTPVANGYLRWNGSASGVEYVTTIPASSITGLSSVSVSGSYTDLINTPVNSDWNLNGLGDTNFTSLQPEDTLLYDGTDWVNVPFPRTTDEVIYVSTFGNDLTADGSQFKPYKTPKAAVDYANSIATEVKPITVQVYPGVYNITETIEMNNRFVSLSGISPTTCLLYNNGTGVPAVRLTSDISTGGSRVSSIGFIGDLPTAFLSQSNFPLTSNESPSIASVEYDIVSNKFGTAVQLSQLPQQYQSTIDSILDSDQIAEEIKDDVRVWPNAIQAADTAIEVSGTGSFTVIDVVCADIGTALKVGTGDTTTSSQTLLVLGSSFTENLIGIDIVGDRSYITLTNLILLGNQTGIIAGGNADVSAASIKIDNRLVKSLGTDKGVVVTTGKMTCKQLIVQNTTVGSEISSIGVLDIDGATYIGNESDALQINTSSKLILTNSTIDRTKVSFVNPANVKISANDYPSYNFVAGTGSNKVELDVSRGSVSVSPGNSDMPAVKFNDYPSTGMYSPGANQIGFAANSNRILTLLPSGEVRVNTTGYEDILTNPNDIPNKKYVDDRIASGGVTIEELPILQARRTSELTPIPVSWSDVVMSTTDVVTQSNIVDLDVVQKQNVVIKQAGVYMLYYNGTASNEFTGRFVINGSVVVPGSLKTGGVKGDAALSEPNISTTCYANLSVNDTVTWQVQASSAGETLLSNGHIVVARMQGVRGEQGPKGDNAGDILATVQTRLESGTQFPVTGSWFTLLYTVTDISSNTDVIEYQGNGVFLVKEDSQYMIHHHLSGSFPANQAGQTRVLKNGTTIVPGSQAANLITQDSEIVGITFIAQFNAGDTIQIQFIFPGGSGTATVTGDAIATITKMTGAEGPQGPQGPAGTGEITLEDGAVALPGVFSTLNFEGPAVSVTDEGAGRATVTISASGSGGGNVASTYFADQFLNTTNDAWAVKNPALIGQDPLYPALTLRRFANGTEEGVGFMYSVPPTATTANFVIKGRTSSGNNGTLIFRIYKSEIPNGGVPAAWSQAIQFTITPTSDQNFHYYTFNNSIADLGLTPGSTYQFQLTRRGNNDGNTGDFFMLEFQAEIV